MTVLLAPEILAQAHAGFDDNAARAKSLDARCYTDPAVMAAERQAIFKKSWQFVGHVSKLAKPGDYAAFDVQGQPVFAVRAKDGSLNAFYNVCKHRAHELLKGEGNIKMVTCPYHAWAYGLDGRLRTARRSEFIEDFNTDDFCLTPVRVEEFASLVFVNLDPDAPSLAEQAGDLWAEMQTYADDFHKLQHAHRITYTIKSNWKNVVDNFLECYHCPVSHKDFCTLFDMDKYKVTTHGIWSSHISVARADAEEGNNAYDMTGASVKDHAVWYLWPNIALLRYPGEGNMMVINIVPIDEETTFETYDFFFLGSEPTEGQWEAIKYVDEVLQREDIDLVESVQRGMNTPAFDKGRYMVDPEGGGMSEHGVHHFHQLLLAAYDRAAGA